MVMNLHLIGSYHISIVVLFRGLHVAQRIYNTNTSVYIYQYEISVLFFRLNFLFAILGDTPLTPERQLLSFGSKVWPV